MSISPPMQDAIEELRSEADRPAALAELERQDILAHRHETSPELQVRRADGVAICCECGDPIERRRLAVLPEAIRCYDCQVEEDRLDAQLRRVYGG